MSDPDETAVKDDAGGNDEPPWMRYAGMVKSGDPGSIESVDEVVYGGKSR